MTAPSQAREVFFVGSVALPDAAAVFRTIGRAFGDTVRRIPDGETGNRLGWMEWQESYLSAHPQLEAEPSAGDWRNPTAPDRWKQKTWYRLKPGVAPEALDLGDIGYADNALQSWEAFSEAKQRGDVAPGVRFMVAIPSPFNLINFHFAPDQRALAEPAYEAALLRELDRIAAVVPHDQLAVQWDCAHDMQAYDGAREVWFDDRAAGIEQRLARIGARVPAGAELGYHFCYGSFGGKHFVEPRDMGAMVRLANALSRQVSRPIAWFHMPVPIERSDDGYFAPLADLRLQPGCRLYLGVIHDQDGAAGAEARIAAARRHLPAAIGDFGIATECGFGRRDPATVAPLIDLHRTLAHQS